MRLTPLLVLFVVLQSPVSADWIQVYPRAEVYWTGAAGNSWYYPGDPYYWRESGDLDYGFSWGTQYYRHRGGFAKFDLSPVPESAVVTGVTLGYYQYRAGLEPLTCVSCVCGDPVLLGAESLYNQIKLGPRAHPFTAHPEVGWVLRELNPTGVARVQNGLANDWVAFGVWPGENLDRYGMAYGYGGPELPYLRIEYGTPLTHDAGVVEVFAPADSVEEGESVTPEASVWNFGIQAESIPVRFTIRTPGSDYEDDTTVVVGAGEDLRVRFAPWQAGPLGSWAVTCSTMLPSDEDPSNDTVHGRVAVLNGDVGTFDIGFDPSVFGSVDSASVVTPSARVKNYGSVARTFSVFLAIDGFYRENTVVTIQPGVWNEVEFPSWSVRRVGTWVARCSTALPGDRNPGNDICIESIIVVPRDAEADSVCIPMGAVDSGTVLTPEVRLRNNSVCLEQTVPARLWIEGGYQHDSSVSVPARWWADASFGQWQAVEPGTYAVRCSTMLTNDADPSNDCCTSSVLVLPGGDVAAIGIISPRGAMDSGVVRPPRARVENLGTNTWTFPVRMRIGPHYSEDTTVTLAPGQQQTVEFPKWIASPVGTLAVVCSTMLSCDRNPDNDSSVTRAVVRAVGIQEPELALGPPRVSFVANPVRSSKAQLQCRFPRKTALHIRLYDATGTMVAHKKHDLPKGKTRVNLDLEHQPNGVYLVRLLSDSFTVTEKLVVQR